MFISFFLVHLHFLNVFHVSEKELFKNIFSLNLLKSLYPWLKREAERDF